MEDSKLVKFRTLIDEVDKNLPGHYKALSTPPKAAFEFNGFPSVSAGMTAVSSRQYNLSICNEYRTNSFVDVFCQYFSPRGYSSFSMNDLSFSDLSVVIDKIRSVRFYSHSCSGGGEQINFLVAVRCCHRRRILQ